MNLKKINKTWIVVIIIVLLVAGYFGFKQLVKNPLDDYVIEKVSIGEVLQEVSETGSVRATDNISLGFKTAGRIESINVFVGQAVSKGQILASIDVRQLQEQLRNYRAALDVAKAQYQKLLSGNTPEDIKTYQDAVASARQDFDSEYARAINTLNDAYIKSYNSYTTVSTIENNYFSFADQQSANVKEARNKINNSAASIKNYLDIAKASSNKNDIDNAIPQTINFLNNIWSALKVVRDMSDEGIYYNKVSSTDKTSLDTQKTNINTALANVTDSQQDIVSYKMALQEAEGDLALRQAEPRQEDIDVYKAQIKQAEANVNLYQVQINDAYLRSPLDGTITRVNAKAGEVVSANEAVINLLSLNPFQIKVDIYEQDIVNVKINDSVEITLISFPKQQLIGKVVLIDPAEKIVDQVVYYETTIDFSNEIEGIKSGMTADIIIETNKKTDVLRAPKNAVDNIAGKEIVQVVTNGKIEDREITTGIEGNDYFEILSGLNEGDKIIVGKK